jgi:hypothetical protein
VRLPWIKTKPRFSEEAGFLFSSSNIQPYRKDQYVGRMFPKGALTAIRVDEELVPSSELKLMLNQLMMSVNRRSKTIDDEKSVI